MVEYRLQIRITLSRQGNYGNQLDLGEDRTVELNTLSDSIALLVKVHELFDTATLLSTKRARA